MNCPSLLVCGTLSSSVKGVVQGCHERLFPCLSLSHRLDVPLHYFVGFRRENVTRE